MAVHPVAQRLLQTALVIVDRDGLDALTIRLLVQESGVSNGSVYHHLESLERLRGLVADEAVKAWASVFLAALGQDGYARAAEADSKWARAHPELAILIASEGEHGGLGDSATRFSSELRDWLNAEQLAIDAPGHLVAAIMIGPLIELRRLERSTGNGASRTEFEALGCAVIAALDALSATR